MFAPAAPCLAPLPTTLPLRSCREVIAQYHPRALRWFLVGTQYRQPINYTQRALEEVRGGAGQLQAACLR